MALKTRPFDVAEQLDTPERIALYLEAAFEDGDPALIAAAIGDAARAYGMTRLARTRASPAKPSTAPSAKTAIPNSPRS